MSKIIPITELRDTNKISKLVKKEKKLYVTRNGYLDLVITDEDYEDNYESNKKKVIPENNIDFEAQDDPMGYIKVASVNFSCRVSDISHNVNEIKKKIDEAYRLGSKIIVFPELSLTSYTCHDLFLQTSLQEGVIKGLLDLKEYSKDYDALIILGAPLSKNDNLYNCAVVIFKGKFLGVIPKSNLPEYNEFYERRYFSILDEDFSTILIGEDEVDFSTKLLFQNTRYKKEVVGVEICEDLWVNVSPSSLHSLHGATLVCNLSSSNETLFKEDYRRKLVETKASSCNIGYIYASSSYEESTGDLIFSGHNIIADPSGILNESKLFDPSTIISEIDLDYITSNKVLNTSTKSKTSGYKIIPFSCKLEIPTLTRTYSKNPFYHLDNIKYEVRKANLMQARGLMKRLKATGINKVVIGVSGGLDSTIALIACIKAFDDLGLPRSNIEAITMPCFGTTSRTKDNATKMCEALGVHLSEVNIFNAVRQHLKDIGLSEDDRSVAYENAQARERTQVLMDYGNRVGALVVGTGDLSEIALGWSTYNGDHMSMYNVNCSLSKTFIKEMTKVLSIDYPEIKEVLLDILDTPVSPELLPGDNNSIAQKTEDILGSYKVHDFILYHFIYHHLSVRRVYFMAKVTFKDEFPKEYIRRCFEIFINRFFNNQFKRSCSTDGPKISEVGLSPRGDLRMASDSSKNLFLDELKSIVD